MTLFPGGNIMSTKHIIKTVFHTIKTAFQGALVAGAAMAVGVATVFSQGFETDTSDWLDENDSPGFGTINRTASGTGVVPVCSE
jgi:phage gp45-like